MRYEIFGIEVIGTATVEVREPVLTISVSPKTVSVGEPVIITASASGCPGDFEWSDSGSGSGEGSGEVIELAYDKPGSYDTTVTFTLAGISITKSIRVIVDAPELVVSAYPDTVDPGEYVTFFTYVKQGKPEFTNWSGAVTGSALSQEI